jgi:hypothetical protein
MVLALNGAAMLLLTWTLAHWTWAFITPETDKPIKVTESSTNVSFDQLSSVLTNAHLLGQIATDTIASASADLLKNIELIGVFAHGATPMAILRIDGKDTALKRGDELMAGAVLDGIFSDHVTIMVGQSVISRSLKNEHPDISLRSPAPEIISVDQRKR